MPSESFQEESARTVQSGHQRHGRALNGSALGTLVPYQPGAGFSFKADIFSDILFL
jgi:hypothetical protein